MSLSLFKIVKSKSRLLLLAFMGMALVGCVSTQAMKRLEVDFSYIEQLAEELSQEPYQSLANEVPEVLKNMDYDDYRKIRFNEDSTLWRDEGMPFQAQFFHLGYLFKEPVELNEFTNTHAQRIPYVKEFFDSSDFVDLQKQLPSSLDYAGFKLLYQLEPESKRYDELVSFLGASYFRALGKDMHYGLSARGLAIDCGLGSPEEFPRFTRFWLGKPLGDSEQMTLFALLDSESVTGAYAFTLLPGKATRIDVKSTIFVRKEMKSFGLAPITSMFWFGENSAVKPSDYRPEVHDSDGLLIEAGDGDLTWRPLDVGSRSRHSYFKEETPRGFGLLQRDRGFESYQDLEAEYHRRPSLWVEPKGDWGKGSVRLLELPTNSEFDDNVVAFWEPAKKPKKGAVLKYDYSLHWTKDGAPVERKAPYAVSTRSGYKDDRETDVVYILEFAAGENYEFSSENKPSLDANIVGDASLVFADVVWNPQLKTWRATLRVHGEEDLGDVVEISCQLNFGDDVSSERWSYQWTR